MSSQLASQQLKVPVLDLSKRKVKRIMLPPVFSIPFIRVDLIQRAVISALTARIQPKGRDPMAGKRTSAESWGVGYDLARVPRVKGERHPKAGTGAFAPFTVGGRMCFPLTTEKIWHEKINKKERKQAIMHAIAATARLEFVKERGHILGEDLSLPIVVVDALEEVSKTSELREILKKLSLWEDVERAKKGIRIRAGKGKMRGRRYKKPKSILFVISQDKGLRRAARNLPGVDVATVEELNVLLLAPGGHPGRLTVWTESAVKKLSEQFS